MARNDMDYKIYVPDTSYACYVVNANGYIRAYQTQPSYNSSSVYRDYYFTNNYYYNDGTQSWGSYSTLPSCLDSSVLTTNIMYRYDYDKILLIFFISVIFIFYIPLHTIFRILPKEKRLC